MLDRLRLSGDEIVVDAGCGSGNVTAELVRRLPGGRGNVAAPVAAIEATIATGRYDRWLSGYESPWTFNGPEQTASWLEGAGFEAIECWLEERSARPEDPKGFFAASFLAPVRERLPKDVFPDFLDQTLAAMGHPVAFEYIRLNIDACRAKGTGESDCSIA